MLLVRENILATCGNLPLFPAGQPIFNNDGSGNVGAGQLAVWDPITKLSLGAGITVQTNDRIVYSVGVDRFTLRSGFGESLFGCNINAATAEGTTCGLAPIYDILFTCTESDEEYTISIQVKDESALNQYPYNKFPTYTYTVKVSNFACNTCDNGIDCIALSCAFRDAINEKRSSLTKRSTFVPSKTTPSKKGFTAHVLYGGSNPVPANPTTKVYCINPLTDSCTRDCIHADTLINEVSFNATTFPLTFTVDPANPTRTLLSQLDSVVSQINTLLDGNGSAVITKGFGRCCPYRLEVNTCYNDFAITGVTPCDSYNPFDPARFPLFYEQECKNCTAATARTFTCGLRIVGDPLDHACDCFPDLNPAWMQHRELILTAVGGFKPGTTYVREVQKHAIPKNLAYNWIVRDYTSDNGGRGREHDPYEHRGYGMAGIPLKRGRSGGISNCLNCAEGVCSYIFEHGLPSNDGTIYATPHNSRGRTIVLIPATDAITRADFEAITNGYLTSSGCPVKRTITCSTDQDQIESPRYPDANGYILF